MNSPSTARRWLAPLAIAALAVAMQCGSALPYPLTRQVGSIYSEAPGHLWGLWTTAAGLFEHGPFVRVAAIGYPEGYTRHLMDVSNLLFFLPGYWLLGGSAAGASLGWNLVHGGCVGAGALGLVALGRRLFGGHPDEPYAVAVAIAVFCASPFLLQHPTMGRTEYLPALWLPLFLALFHRWMRRPAGVDEVVERRPPVWVGVAAGFVLAAVVLGGWYLAAFAALLAPPLAIAWGRGLRPAEAFGRVVLVGIVAALPALPALHALLDSTAGGRSLGLTESRILPTTSVWVMLRAPDPQLALMHMGQPAYVGLVGLGAAVLGALARPRQAAGWLALAAWAFLLAAGPYASLSSQPPGAPDAERLVLPAAYILHYLPVFTPISDWTRMSVVAALPLAIGAAWGVLALGRWPRVSAPLALAVCGLALADQATFPKRWTLDQPWFRSAAPAELLDGLSRIPDGPVLVLPIDIQHREMGGPEVHGLGFLWQLQHGRPVPGVPEGRTDMTLTHSWLSRASIVRQQLSVALRGGSLDPTAVPTGEAPAATEEEARCARVDAAELRDRGYVGVAVVTSLAGGVDLGAYVTGLLGEPAFAEGPAWVWDLARVPEATGMRCTMADLPERIAREQAGARPSGGGAPGMAVPGMGVPGMGVSGAGAAGMPAPGLAAPGPLGGPAYRPR